MPSMGASSGNFQTLSANIGFLTHFLANEALAILESASASNCTLTL